MAFRKIAAELFESTNCKRVGDVVEGWGLVDFAVVAVVPLGMMEPFRGGGLKLRGLVLFLAWSSSFFGNSNSRGDIFLGVTANHAMRRTTMASQCLWALWAVKTLAAFWTD